jgi:type I restriction enzyme R subunit
MSDPAFLLAEWPDVHDVAARAAAAVYPDRRTACFYARRALELAVSWAYRANASPPSISGHLSALIQESRSRRLLARHASRVSSPEKL